MIFGKPKTLKQAQKFLSKIPNINDGGCGVSALSLYRWIKDNLEIGNTKFVFLYPKDEEDRYKNNSRALINEDDEAEACDHCCLFYKNEFIDCDGVELLDRYEWIQMIDQEDFIKRALENVGDWNSCFDRRQIKNIEKGLGIDLEDIKGLNEVED